MEQNHAYYFSLLTLAKNGNRFAKDELFTVCEPYIRSASMVDKHFDEELFSCLEIVFLRCIELTKSTSWFMFVRYLNKCLRFKRIYFLSRSLKKETDIEYDDDVLYNRNPMNNDVLSDVLDAISTSLTQEEKELVFMRSIQDMSFAAIGEKLHISADLARAKYHYALKKTRKRLNRPP